MRRFLPASRPDPRYLFLWVIFFQGFHEFEHIVQVVQRFTLNIPNGNGIIGQAVDVEPLHFLYNFVLLLFLGILWWAADLPRRRGRDWGRLGFGLVAFGTVAQCWHMVEHVAKIIQYLPNHVNGTPGLLGVYFNVVWLHFFYNTLVYLPLLLGFFAAGMPAALLGAERMRRIAVDVALALVLAAAVRLVVVPLFSLMQGAPEPIATLGSALLALGFSFGPTVVRAVLPPPSVASFTPSPVPALPAAIANVLLWSFFTYALVQVARSVWLARAARLLPPRSRPARVAAAGPRPVDSQV